MSQGAPTPPERHVAMRLAWGEPAHLGHDKGPDYLGSEAGPDCLGSGVIPQLNGSCTALAPCGDKTTLPYQPELSAMLRLRVLG